MGPAGVTERWVSFDCYGTLVDWLGGLADALRPAAGDHTDSVLASALAFAFALESNGPYRPYRKILSEGLRRAAAQERVFLRSDKLLVEAWPNLPVYSDVPGCLEELAGAGWRLAVLTNCDDDLFAATAGVIAVPFDEVVTAQQVRSYKPSPAHFEEFRRRTGASTSNWVHVANSWVADIVPTRQLRIPRIWVNRDRDGNDPSLASMTLPDFASLVPELSRLVPQS